MNLVRPIGMNYYNVVYNIIKCLFITYKLYCIQYISIMQKAIYDININSRTFVTYGQRNSSGPRGPAKDLLKFQKNVKV